MHSRMDDRFADGRTIKPLPDGLERNQGFEDYFVVRTKRRVRWHGHGADDKEKAKAHARLQEVAATLHLHLCLPRPLVH